MSVSSSKRNRGNNGKNDKYARTPPAQDNKNSNFFNNNFKELTPKNWVQQEYLRAIIENDIVFGVGSAGTGKTFVAAHYAAGELFHKRIDKIILTRPNVEAGPSLGFLPGELEEKYAPYLEPFADVLKRALGPGFYEYALKSKQIEPIPIGFLRGKTFDNAIVLVDESQNIDPHCMELILSRIGNNTKMVFSGDTGQKDIQGTAGLADAIKVLEGVPGVEVVRFTSDDIVRSHMCKKIIKAYESR